MLTGAGARAAGAGAAEAAGAGAAGAAAACCMETLLKSANKIYAVASTGDTCPTTYKITADNQSDLSGPSKEDHSVLMTLTGSTEHVNLFV